jgi:hypothetical protein
MIRKLHWDPDDEKNRAIKWNELDKLSKSRLGNLINDRLEAPYGLSNLRSIEDFGSLAGIDLFNKKVIDEEVATSIFCFKEIESETEPFLSIVSKNE